ncbi:hypothetical protein D8B26_005415 [Coccidioides posadasii str. Silveira]|uniref:Uncharacterized protein n=1 Tax=Coccidioides posadasii (strain RMSCC 757 / Silveira) TaxID=443226 RepID=E9DJV7_COCPS|nr:conserved hypothetical protein [Coccidioides posadasii str. Silveira]QVM10762.1 hypothetical protein D8B26_005415 [Coccidioides posadasii str. Silveira]
MEAPYLISGELQMGVPFRMISQQVQAAHLVASSAYPNERQLASIISQAKGLSHLATVGLEHTSLTCSNILIGFDGVIKIAGLEFCEEHPLDQSQAQSIQALVAITMELMQKHGKDDGVVGVDDLNRWPIDSDAVKFLSAASSATCLEILKQHPLIMKQHGSAGELVGLARLALISTRTFYCYK